MSRIKMEIEFKTNADLYKIYLDNKTIRFKDGKATKYLEAGKDYWFCWFLMGEEDSIYTLKVLSPPQATLSIEDRRLGRSKKEGGGYWVEA